MKRLIPLYLFLLLIPACQRSLRPGAIDQLDSQTYDTLLVFQSLLDNTKIQIQQGKLPDSTKPIVNDAGKAYNGLRDAWLAYRAAPSATASQRISEAALEVSKFITQLRGLGGK